MTNHEEKEKSQLNLIDKIMSGEGNEEWLSEFLEKQGKNILTGFLAVVVLIFAAYLWFGNNRGKATYEFAEAEVAFQHLELASAETGNEDNWISSYLTLKRVMDKHPELYQKYSGSLAQLFIRLGDLEKAIEYAKKSMPHLTQEGLNFYENFSQTSLIIAKGDFESALQRSTTLSKEMATDPSPENAGKTLLVFNAIREAALLQEKLYFPKEIAKWNSLESAFKDEAFEAFRTGKVTMNDYVDARKEAVKKKKKQ